MLFSYKSATLLIAALSAISCEASHDEAASASPRSRGVPAMASAPAVPRVPPPVHVDSYMPIEEALRRFRAGLREKPTQLALVATSRDSLVGLFVRAIETRDTALVNELDLSRAEFAYLYYPTSPLTRPPYELDPQMLWFQIITGSEKGISRVFDRVGGRPLGYAGYQCAKEPERQEQNRIWSDCKVRRIRAEGDTITQRLFGSIIERSGRYKFVSYSNDL